MHTEEILSHVAWDEVGKATPGFYQRVSRIDSLGTDSEAAIFPELSHCKYHSLYLKE